MTTDGISPLKLGVTLAIDYVRWTQLSPLITIWAFAIAMLAAMLFVNHEEASWDALGALIQWIANLPVIGGRFTTWMESLADQDGAIKLGGTELKSAALKAWSLLSLAFMALAALANWAFGPFKPWSLKRKLGFAAMCSLVLLAGFVAVYFSNPQQFNGPAGNWMLTFSGLALLLFVVSAWCLSIAHMLGFARRAVEDSRLGSSHGSA